YVFFDTETLRAAFSTPHRDGRFHPPYKKATNPQKAKGEYRYDKSQQDSRFCGGDTNDSTRFFFTARFVRERRTGNSRRNAVGTRDESCD
ncbi:MAG: hypothetical protein J5530_06670, partial [Clostridia bacterium]|nr:hypothetical protein [Clostridia bacterium]